MKRSAKLWAAASERLARLETGNGAPRLSPRASEARDAYWRERWQQERERLAKLWVAYQAAEQEVAELRGRLAQAELPKQVWVPSEKRLHRALAQVALGT